MTMYFFECKECGYDSKEAKKLARRTGIICPLCAGDTGKDVDLHFRKATTEEIEELGAP